MFKSCLIYFLLFNVCFKTFLFHSQEEEEKRKTRKEIQKLADIEAKLNKLRSLLKEPRDEEHEDLENESDQTHAHEWTVQLNTDNFNDVVNLTRKYGFDHVHKLDVGYGVFRIVHSGNKKREIKNKIEIKRNDDAEVEATISKRDHIDAFRRLSNNENIRWYKRERILQREKRVPLKDAYREAHEVEKRSKNSFNDVTPNDPQFHSQWYIKNDGQTTGPAGFDSNIEPVWKKGFTGKGVVLSVLDDGMDHTHPELEENYDPVASTDLNGHKDDPFPNDSDPYNAHGTKCSGTIAAKNNNSLCGVGIAFNSKIGGIRMLDGRATDALEANALSFSRNHIDIYSCSWGPKDNGATFGRPGKLGKIALQQGAKFGRNGKGSLFIWATGNGGIQYDDCNADGYVNSIYTLGIGAVNEHGVSTYYGERCAAMFAVTYCSGKHSAGFNTKDPKANVITTYLHHQCTDHFVGTSSAAPLAAGIFALVLEANNNITWRDLQHLVFETAQKVSPNDLGWQKNGVGKEYNHKFGFGVLDADRLVTTALSWKQVPEQRSCHFSLKFTNGNIPSKQHFRLIFKTDGCQACKEEGKDGDGKCKNRIDKLEHVVVNITLKHRRRGDLSIQLISPNGTVSNLLHQRPYDGSSSGLKGWTFMTVYNWGENPNGMWTLIFADNKIETFKKDTRDLEAEYMEKLDREKKHDESIANDHNHATADQVDDQADEKVVTAHGKTYKRSDLLRRIAKRLYQRRQDYNQYYDGSDEEQRYADDDESYRRRVKRSSKFEDNTDYVKYKKDNSENFKYKYEDDVLKKGDLAGEVLGISVTLYGTS